MLISRNLHKKSSEVSIQTRSPPASLSFKGQATKHTTVKWSIDKQIINKQRSEVLNMVNNAANFLITIIQRV